MATSVEAPESDGDHLRSEYDFRPLRGVVQGNYAVGYRVRLRVVRLADDVAKAFAEEASVNAALREYLRGHGAAASDHPR